MPSKWNFQISSRLQWNTTQHFKRVILFIPFCSSERRFVIRDFAFSLYPSEESRFYIMHVYSDIQLEAFSGVIFTTHKRTVSSDFRAQTNNRNHGTYSEINVYIIILVQRFLSIHKLFCESFIPLSLQSKYSKKLILNFLLY